MEHFHAVIDKISFPWATTRLPMNLSLVRLEIGHNLLRSEFFRGLNPFLTSAFDPFLPFPMCEIHNFHLPLVCTAHCAASSLKLLLVFDIFRQL